jgi:hypothetical protein
MPVARVAASMTDTSPRARMVSPPSTSMLAGVSSGVRPRRLPVCVGSSMASGVRRSASTCTVARLPLLLPLLPFPPPGAAADCASAIEGPNANPSTIPNVCPEPHERPARCARSIDARAPWRLRARHA